LIDLVYYY